MKESESRKILINLWEDKGWVLWYPQKVRWKKEIDIFGVFDLIAVKGNKIIFIQLTSVSNIRAREKKVRKFLEKNDVSVYAEIWGIRKDKTFRIIRMY